MSETSKRSVCADLAAESSASNATTCFTWDSGVWPLHDIVIANIVWCIAYKRDVGRGVVYGPIIVQ